MLRNLPDFSRIVPQINCLLALQISKRGRLTGGVIPDGLEVGNDPELIGHQVSKEIDFASKVLDSDNYLKTIQDIVGVCTSTRK